MKFKRELSEMELSLLSEKHLLSYSEHCKKNKLSSKLVDKIIAYRQLLKPKFWGELPWHK